MLFTGTFFHNCTPTEYSNSVLTQEIRHVKCWWLMGRLAAVVELNLQAVFRDKLEVLFSKSETDLDCIEECMEMDSITDATENI